MDCVVGLRCSCGRRLLCNDDLRRRRRYRFSPAALATRSHLAKSSRMKAAKSSGLPPAMSKPCRASVATTSGDFAASLEAAARRSMMSRGVPAGASNPNQPEVSNPVSPASEMVGRSGATLARRKVLEASASDGALQQRVAVVRRVRHEIGGDVAAGAAAVLDDELLAELLAERLREHARGDIARGAGGKTDDDAHRPRRIALRLGEPHGERGSTGYELQKSTTWKCHGGRSLNEGRHDSNPDRSAV